MLFGRYINKYYLKYAIFFIIGVATLVMVDIAQLFIPEYLGNFIPDDKKKSLYEFIKELIPFVQIYNIYFKDIDISCINFDHILVSFLVAKYNSGFILDITIFLEIEGLIFWSLKRGALKFDL